MQATAVPNQQETQSGIFPLVLQPVQKEELASSIAWIEENRTGLLKQVEKHGAVLIRGMQVETPEDFDVVVSSLQLENFPYRKSLSNAVRRVWTDRVFSANEAPSHVRIFFHHEMAQTPFFPQTIMFCCLVAPTSGGATPLCRSDLLFDAMVEAEPGFVSELELQGLRYSNVMPSEDDAKSGMGRSWRSTLGVDTQEGAESRLKELGYEWTWQDDSSLRTTTPILPAVRTLDDGRRVFFNQLIAAFCGWRDSRNDPSDAIRMGDGTRLDENAVKVAFELAEQYAFDLQWQRGDVAIVDNRVVMHARRPFKGKRQVLASLAQVASNPFPS